MRKPTIEFRVQQAALQILEKVKDGILLHDLFDQVLRQMPQGAKEGTKGTIWEACRKVPQAFADRVEKSREGRCIRLRLIPSRPTSTFANKLPSELESMAARSIERPQGEINRATEKDQKPSRHERIYYEPFAKWLEIHSKICHRAFRLGEKWVNHKWENPDVIGVFRPPFAKRMQLPLKLVTVEIKTQGRDLLQSFGQASSYCIFSNYVYLVIPKPDEKDATKKTSRSYERLDVLCHQFGIGLVFIDQKFKKSLDPNKIFEERVRPKELTPDPEFQSEFLAALEVNNSEIVGKLFD